MSVLITNRQNSQKIVPEKVKKAAKAALNALECPDGELSLLIVDDAEIAVFNRDYLRREGPTNVIAFPMREGEFGNINPLLLGDVVISSETAQREAEDIGIGTEERFMQLLIHGILHLFGYDHENDEEEAVRMETKSEELLTLISADSIERQ
ncbi:MAG: rRNA maturation RNase YbeY [Desulfobacteraceae bacterium IS3]|nr:MAG: rRNA maturation RNase YbeY [Desulfobacteraceae bacterium IS3]